MSEESKNLNSTNGNTPPETSVNETIAALEAKVESLELVIKLYRGSQQAKDNKIRSNFEFRKVMLKIVHGLDDMLHDYGADAAIALELDAFTGYFTGDTAREIMLWQLIEFLTASRCPRDEEHYQACIKAHQLTEPHAREWWGIGTTNGKDMIDSWE